MGKYVLFIFLLLSVISISEAPAQQVYAATDSQAIAELSAQEMQFLRADFFPLSLAEKGRQSAPTWRGMPPGYLDTEFGWVPLVNPLWGYWDNQLVPIEIISQNTVDQVDFTYNLVPLPVSQQVTPVTRIAYAQDFQFGLSYLDGTLTRFYRKNSYFRLGGKNFIQNGSAGEYSKIQVNTYRVQFHHQFSKKFNVDLWYLQLRHKFALSPFPVVSELQKFHRIGQVLWLNLHYNPDSTQGLVITPYGYKWGDRFATPGYIQQRKTELYSLGLKLDYYRMSRLGSVKFEGNAIRHKITRAFVFRKKSQYDGQFALSLHKGSADLWLTIRAGYRLVPDVGGAPELGASWGWKPEKYLESVLSLYQRPQTLPLSTRFWTGYSVTALSGPKLPVRRGISWKLKLTAAPALQLDVEPYYNKFSDAWTYRPSDQYFIQRNFDNTGILCHAGLNLWFFDIRNQFTYNFEKSYIPEFNNILSVRLPITLFGGALKLENYGIYHYIKKWYRVDFDPLVNQYYQADQTIDYLYLLDAKILAHIKTATLFFVWENLLSQDYALVDGYSEVYRLFRFGIYWTLFD
jgi:hypothetical protein